MPINYKCVYVKYAVKVNDEDKEVFETNVVCFDLFRLKRILTSQCSTIQNFIKSIT
jgi:hypothetical protein